MKTKGCCLQEGGVHISLLHSVWRAFFIYSLDARGQTGISVHWPTSSLSLCLDKDSLSASQYPFAAREWQLSGEEATAQRE